MDYLAEGKGGGLPGGGGGGWSSYAQKPNMHGGHGHGPTHPSETTGGSAGGMGISTSGVGGGTGNEGQIGCDCDQLIDQLANKKQQLQDALGSSPGGNGTNGSPVPAIAIAVGLGGLTPNNPVFGLLGQFFGIGSTPLGIPRAWLNTGDAWRLGWTTYQGMWWFSLHGGGGGLPLWHIYLNRLVGISVGPAAAPGWALVAARLGQAGLVIGTAWAFYELGTWIDSQTGLSNYVGQGIYDGFSGGGDSSSPRRGPWDDWGDYGRDPWGGGP